MQTLLVNRLDLVMQSLTGSASTQIPRRLRKTRGLPMDEIPAALFALGMTLEKLQEHLSSDAEPTYDVPHQTSLEAYEGIVDGLLAMSCHPNISVRGDAISIAEFAFTRFAWVIKPRIPRLLAAISLRDSDLKGVYGIPSCEVFVSQINSLGKRSRLAETIKGVTKLVGLPKVMKEILQTEDHRFEIVQMLCNTQRLLSLLPPEEVPKVVHYVTSIFLQLRSRWYALLRATASDQSIHEACLQFLLGILEEGTTGTSADESKGDEDDAGAIHWKNRLIVAWMLTNFIDEVDLLMDDPAIMKRVWAICFKLIVEEVDQPLQRVAVGLLGRLVSLALVDMSVLGTDNTASSTRPDISTLCDVFGKEDFCRVFSFALAFDHREDSSVGGGHKAQWSAGVEEILRDATANLAPKTLFPFQRISNTSHTFKLGHAQLVEGILVAIGNDKAKVACRFLLSNAKELVASPPSEDQKNQLITSAEIFSGVCRALVRYNNKEAECIWESILIPFLSEAVQKMPTAFISAFFDAVRYGIHHMPPSRFFPLLTWAVSKVRSTLWQHEANSEDVDESNASSALADRFAVQSKYLLLVQSVLIELDSEDDLGAACQLPWYSDIFLSRDSSTVESTESNESSTEAELGQAWRYVSENLIPCLLNAIGHPYEKCRDHIASCLFRMCYCHRKFFNVSKSQGSLTESFGGDPGKAILKQLCGIRESKEYSFKEKLMALGTSRKFVACCVHWGDAKHEFSEFIIPLLPLSFESLETTEGEVSSENRGMEAEVVKGFRYSIADISSSCVVSYGVSRDMTRVLDVLKKTSQSDVWQVRQASAHFLRCFQGGHKFLMSEEQEEVSMSIAISLLADERREVSNAAMSTLTGILAVLPQFALEELVSKYINIANKSLKKKKRKIVVQLSPEDAELAATKEKARAKRQQKSVFVLCAVVMGRPYDTPPYVPEALAALSKHSFEQRASLGVREVVKLCCSEFKRTHTDNWEAHRNQFTQAQLEALEDVVSTPHYYA